MDPPSHPNDSQPGNGAQSAGPRLEEASPEEGGFVNASLKYINRMLMEDNIEEKTNTLHDSLALQAAEKSFYEVLSETHLPLRHIDEASANPDGNFVQNSSSSSAANNFVDSNWFSDLGHFGASLEHTPLLDHMLQSNSKILCSPGNFSDINHVLLDNSVSTFLAPGSCCESQPVARVRDISAPSESREKARLKGKKNQHENDGDDLQGRSTKQMAVHAQNSEPPNVFDEALLYNDLNMSKLCINDDEASKKLQQNERSKGSNTKVGRVKRRSKGEVVDLRSLLIQCAQAVAGNDQRASTELLKLIRQHSSPMGDGSQRLAHFFANGLEARLVGLGMKIYEEYKAPAIERPLAADIIRAYKVYASACPSKRMSYFFANWMIGKVAEKATRLHIIDFGILFGFQWPSFIQHLSQRPGRPPRLRITGIDFPQPGFRPAERVEDSGDRLADYCNRFKVPFEYHAIAEKWENIRLEDLKIDKDEKLVVNSLYRLKNLLDETVVEDCPRDAVLNLIRRINPEIFIHGIVNGSFNGPFFLLRFKEALHQYDALFDMLDATVPREDQDRMLFEKVVYGRYSMNIIAHEGSERFERPETYKQWQARNVKAGFRQLLLDQEILSRVRTTVKQGFRKNFMVEEDGGWMLQGWKGRTIHALSCWKLC